jgi:PST family polysaccharide transporter
VVDRVVKSSLERATVRGALWSNLSFLGTRVITALYLAVLARLLVPSEFGVFAAVLVFVAVVELTSDLGMKATVIYEQEEGFSRRVETAFTLNVAVAVVLSLGGVLLSPVIAAFFRMEEHTELFRLASLNPLIKGFGNIHDALLIRGMSFARRIRPELAMVATRAVVAIPLAAGGLGTESLVIGMLAGTVVWTGLQWRVTAFRPRFAFDRSLARSMAGYSSAAMALNGLGALGARLDVVVVGRVLGERALGLYTIGSRIPELLIDSIAWNLSLVAFPALARKRVADQQGLADATAKLMRYYTLFAAPLAAGLAVLGPPLVVTMFGSAWRDAAAVASAMALFTGIASAAYPLGDVFKATGKQRVLVALTLIQMPITVTTIILIAPAGIAAVAWVRVAAVTSQLTLLLILVSRELRTSARTFLAALAPAAVTAAGVAIGSGAVRLLWPDLSLAPLMVGAAAGCAGGLLALRLCAPSTYAEIRDLLPARTSARERV